MNGSTVPSGSIGGTSSEFTPVTPSASAAQAVVQVAVAQGCMTPVRPQTQPVPPTQEPTNRLLLVPSTTTPLESISTDGNYARDYFTKRAKELNKLLNTDPTLP